MKTEKWDKPCSGGLCGRAGGDRWRPAVFVTPADARVPGSPSVPNWKSPEPDEFNPGISDSLRSAPARNPAHPRVLAPFLKPSWNPADTTFWSGLREDEHGMLRG